MPTPTLVYKNGVATGAAAFLSTLDTLLTNSFNPLDPRGLGWASFFNGGDGGQTTSLNASLNNSATTVVVVSTTGFTAPGMLIIDSEEITYTSLTPTSFTGCLRGAGGTTPASHSNTTSVSSLKDKFYESLGSGQSERIFLRLTASLNDQYIERRICQTARNTDGYMVNKVGGLTGSRITVGTAQFEYWLVGNQDFFHLVILIGSTYSHYYCGIINRYAPNQNSSIYGQIAPVPANTTTPTSSFTVATSTVLFLRTGFDAYGGYDATNLSFQPGQKLAIIDQSIGTSTSGNVGYVIINSADTVANTINVTYLAGNNTFSSFSIIGVDPQPTALNTGGTIRGNNFLMIDDFGSMPPPVTFMAVDEFATNNGVPENLENPDARGVYITYPIRIWNSVETRGTLYGVIDTPIGAPGPQDLFQTFDLLYRFINFPDGLNNSVAIGSII